MNKQELKDLTYKMIEERVSKGVELFNSLVRFPVIYNELKRSFRKNTAICTETLFETPVFFIQIGRKMKFWMKSFLYWKVVIKFHIRETDTTVYELSELQKEEPKVEQHGKKLHNNTRAEIRNHAGWR